MPIRNGVKNPVLSIPSYSGDVFLSKFLSNLIALILVIGAIYFVFTLLIGAIQWISAGGDKGQLETAKSRVYNSLVGVLILLSVYAVVSTLGTFLGFNILTIDISTLFIK